MVEGCCQQLTLKGKAVPVHTIKACTASRDVATLMLSLGT